MSPADLYPLRFEPMYEYRPWGGRRLAEFLSAALPGDGPVGEAWLLSDRDDHPSLVADGPLKGRGLRELMELLPEGLLGESAGRLPRFPLLLKFLDVQGSLSVQVHPSDGTAGCIPPGESGKTEAWVVLEAGPASRIYAGLKPRTSEEELRMATLDGSVPDHLESFFPKIGDAILVPAGTVHSLEDVVVFEVQENSDTTFRLHDWKNVDSRTGRPRPLQVEQALACIDYTRGRTVPVTPVLEGSKPVAREKVFDSEHFGVWRINAHSIFSVGHEASPRVLACLSGSGILVHDGADYPIGKGEVMLLPAAVGTCLCRPRDGILLLEISLPEDGRALPFAAALGRDCES